MSQQFMPPVVQQFRFRCRKCEVVLSGFLAGGGNGTRMLPQGWLAKPQGEMSDSITSLI